MSLADLIREHAPVHRQIGNRLTGAPQGVTQWTCSCGIDLGSEAQRWPDHVEAVASAAGLLASTSDDDHTSQD